MTLPVPRDNIGDIVRRRNSALDLYAEAFTAIAAADSAIEKAHAAARAAAPIKTNGRYSYHLKETMDQVFGLVRCPIQESYLRATKRIVDTSCWQHVIEMSDLEMLMDKESKDKLHQQMMEPEPVHSNHRGYDRSGTFQEIAKPEDVKGTMPEFTEESVVATLKSFIRDAEMIFRRGVANAFSKLDRRFRSHDGFKIGHRIIFNHAFDGWGHWNYRNAERDSIYDVERALRILDGKPPNYVYNSIVQQIENERRGGIGARQSVHEAEYFRVRIFQNGNCHMWFTRDDLVEKVNKLLADYYGEVIADAKTEGVDSDPFAEIKRTPAKFFGFYPTPEAVANTMFDDLPFHRGNSDRQLTVLEPSAGTGNLARMALQNGAMVDCCEIQPHLADGLRSDPRYRKIWCQDFLALQPETTGEYDLVLQNPPFDFERDIDHVMHAWNFVAPGGTLRAIMSAGTRFRETRKATAFRGFVDTLGKWPGPWHDLPPNSFSSVGTNVNTVLVTLHKPRPSGK
jgi:hypothetical protein